MFVIHSFFKSLHFRILKKVSKYFKSKFDKEYFNITELVKNINNKCKSINLSEPDIFFLEFNHKSLWVDHLINTNKNAKIF